MHIKISNKIVIRRNDNTVTNESRVFVINILVLMGKNEDNGGWNIVDYKLVMVFLKNWKMRCFCLKGELTEMANVITFENP